MWEQSTPHFLFSFLDSFGFGFFFFLVVLLTLVLNLKQANSLVGWALSCAVSGMSRFRESVVLVDCMEAHTFLIKTPLVYCCFPAVQIYDVLTFYKLLFDCWGHLAVGGEVLKASLLFRHNCCVPAKGQILGQSDQLIVRAGSKACRRLHSLPSSASTFPILLSLSQKLRNGSAVPTRLSRYFLIPKCLIFDTANGNTCKMLWQARSYLCDIIIINILKYCENAWCI